MHNNEFSCMFITKPRPKNKHRNIFLHFKKSEIECTEKFFNHHLLRRRLAPSFKKYTTIGICII